MVKNSQTGRMSSGRPAAGETLQSSSLLKERFQILAPTVRAVGSLLVGG